MVRLVLGIFAKIFSQYVVLTESRQVLTAGFTSTSLPLAISQTLSGTFSVIL
jgi:hypothetical protein